MAQIDFPNNAVDGQQFLINGVLYSYNQEKNIWLGLNTEIASQQTAAENLADLGDVNFNNLNTGELFYYNGTEWINSSLRIDDVFIPSSHRYEVTNSGSIYKINQIDSNLDNPNVTVSSGTTVSFKLNTPGHPFRIQNSAGDDYNTGLTHVSTDGIVSTGTNAQGKISGTLYWQIPYTLNGEFFYQCSIHGVQKGSIIVKSITGSQSLGFYDISLTTLELDLQSSNIFKIDLDRNIETVNFTNLPPADVATAYTLIITSSGAYDINWGTAVLWPDGSPPILTPNGKDVISLLTTDGGTSFNGFAAGQNFLAVT